MMKLFGIGLLLLSSLSGLGQGPTTLDTFTSPDGTFQFLYSERYQLLAGESILKATQVRNQGIPVCDFSTALACVIYPIGRLDNTQLEAAGFSVNAVPSVTAESDCLAYSDRSARLHGDLFQPSPVCVNGRVLKYASTKKTTTGHSQFSGLYRTFHKESCYELRIAVSFSDSQARQSSSSKSLENAGTDSARESLKLILASFVFK